MNTADQQIQDILAKFGEPLAGNVWRVQGNAVIYHKTLERIAASAEMRFDAPQILRAERDEAVILVTGHLGEKVEWSIGEACIGVNYRVSGRQAAYVWAMAEKRAKDRVILKLIGLHGHLYSEEESDEFKASAKGHVVVDEAGEVDGNPGLQVRPEDALRRKIEGKKSEKALTDLMLSQETAEALEKLPVGIADELRKFARDRVRALRAGDKGARGPAKDEPQAAPVGVAQRPPSQEAGALCADRRFWAYLREECGTRQDTEEEAATEYLRGYCQVKSRSEIKPGTKANESFRELKADFEAWLVREGMGA